MNRYPGEDRKRCGTNWGALVALQTKPHSYQFSNTKLVSDNHTSFYKVHDFMIPLLFFQTSKLHTWLQVHEVRMTQRCQLCETVTGRTLVSSSPWSTLLVYSNITIVLLFLLNHIVLLVAALPMFSASVQNGTQFDPTVFVSFISKPLFQN